MADEINKQITVDVRVNTDGQQQIDQYKASFNSLRTSINNLGKPISDLSTSIDSLDKDISKFTDTISKLNSQNQSSASIGEKLKSNIEGLTSSYKAWKEAIIAIQEISEGWVGILAAGLSILTQYAPQILDWISNITKSNTALTAYTKALKDYKIIMDALNSTRAEGEADAQKELARLKLLYNAAQDHTLALKDRKKIAMELKDMYPDILGKLSTEAILAGKAKKSYDELTHSIIAASQARAAENRMTKNAERALGNNDKLEKLNKDLTEYQRKLKNAQKDYSEHVAHPGVGGSSFTGGMDSEEQSLYQKMEHLDELVVKTKESISHLDTDSKLLDKQNEILAKSIVNDTAKYGVKTMGLTKKSIDQQISYSSTAKQKLDNHLSETEQKQHEAIMQQLQMTNNAYAQAALAEDQNYKEEKAKLKQMLDDKLISLLQYNKEAQRIEAEHKEGMGAILDKFIRDDSVKTTDLQNKLVGLEAKSFGPDKIESQLNMTNLVNVKRIDLEQQYQDKVTKKVKLSAEERANIEKQAAQKVSDTAFSIISKNIRSQSDAKIKGLETDKALELNNKSLTSAQKQAIEQKYKKQENAVKLKAFKSEQKASIAQAIINGAIAITKSEADLGPIAGTIAIAAIIANTAAQVATITSQKPPAMAKGGYFRSDGKGAVLSGYSRADDTNAFLRSGEAVVVSEAMRDPWARNLVSAINVAYGGRDFSVPNVSRGYAVGGIFTDGGNANRYYNQPINDQKNLANTVAYQMINNFPPVYVDVKDINNQQNILAQTINRVNL